MWVNLNKCMNNSNNLCVLDGQSFTSCKSGRTSERAEAADGRDGGGGDAAVGDRRDQRALRRGIGRRTAGVQSVAVLRGPLRPHPGPQRHPQFPPSEDSEGRHRHRRR